MTHQVYAFEPRSRFVAGTVGPPGDRTFFLQARGGGRLVSVALEKMQVSLLADKLEELLDEVRLRFGVESSPTPPTRQRARSTPRSTRSSGSARWAWPGTPTPPRVVIEAVEVGEGEPDEDAEPDSEPGPAPGPDHPGGDPAVH